MQSTESNSVTLNLSNILDLIITVADPNGSASGESYLVYRTTSGFSATLELSSLNGSNGFVINGIDASDHSTGSVSAAGDVDGDGIDDLIIGAYGANINGNSFTGESYVVFGSDTGLLSIDENTTAVADIQSTDDVDSEGSGLTYSISGGDDSALFTIDSSSNLSFLVAPDFEIPGDVCTDNNYEVQVTVTDSDSLSDMLNLIITVDDVGGG